MCVDDDSVEPVEFVAALVLVDNDPDLLELMFVAKGAGRLCCFFPTL